MNPQPVTHRLALLLSIAVVASGVAAQKTWIVDAANGAGTHFTDLPPALAKVADGDHVIVRAGRYNPGTLSKAIRLFGETGAVVDLGKASFTITGIAAGKTCVVRGLAFSEATFLANTALHVRDNAGLVVLQSLHLNGRNRLQLYLLRSAGVALADSTVRSNLTVEESELTASRCTIGPPKGGIGVGIFGYKARIELTQCSVNGSDGGSHLPAYWAIRSAETELLIRGDASSRYIAGRYGGQSTTPSIDGRGSTTLVVDPAVVLAPAPIGLTRHTRRVLPALHTQGGKLGQPFSVEMRSKAGDPYVVGVSVPRTPFMLPWGRHWLDIPSEILVLFGRQGTTGSTKHSFTVPTTPALRGVTLGWQALTGRGQAAELTNADVVVLR